MSFLNSLGAGVSGAMQVFGGDKQRIKEYKKALEQLAEYTEKGAKELRTYSGKAQGYYDPYVKSGLSALGQMEDSNTFRPYLDEINRATDSAYFDRITAPSKFNYEADPGYEWMKGQSLNALGSSLGAGGKFYSGKARVDATSQMLNPLISSMYNTLYSRYMDEANNRYGMATQNASDQFNREYGNRWNTLQSLFNTGSNFAGTSGATAYNTGNSLANLYSGLGMGMMGGRQNLGEARAKQFDDMARWNYESAQQASKGMSAMGMMGGMGGMGGGQ